jgi:hypothetical protein
LSVAIADCSERLSLEGTPDADRRRVNVRNHSHRTLGPSASASAHQTLGLSLASIKILDIPRLATLEASVRLLRPSRVVRRNGGQRPFCVAVGQASMIVR